MSSSGTDQSEVASSAAADCRPEPAAEGTVPEIRDNSLGRACGTPGAVHVASWLLLLVLGLAAAARLYGLEAKPLWFDETLSWRLQNFPLPVMVQRTGAEATVHPPLYFALLHCWTRCFGDSVFSLRFPSAVFGVLSVALMYLLGRDLVVFSLRGEDRQRSVFGGLLAAFLLAISPYQIHAAHQVRPYTLGIFLAVLSSWLLVRVLRARTRRAIVRGWLSYALAAVAFCYTHNLALFSLAAQGIFAAVVLGSAGRAPAMAPPGPARLAGHTRCWACIAAAIVVAGYLPWAPQVFAQSENMRTSWSRPLRGVDLVRSPAAALVATADSRPEDSLVFAGGVLAVLLIGLALTACGGGRAGVLVLLMGVVPPLLILAYSMQSSRSIFSPRYFAFAQPFWLLAFVLLACRPADRALRCGLAVLMLFWSAAACAEQWDMVGRRRQPGMPAAVDYIRAHRGSGEPVIAETVEVLLKLLYYSEGAFRPLLHVDSLDQQHLSWAPQLVQEDFATGEQILGAEPAGIWVVSSGFYGHLPSSRLAVPAEFKRRDAAHFEQDMHWEQRIEVRYYRRQ